LEFDRGGDIACMFSDLYWDATDELQLAQKEAPGHN
jgi:hypothetical protein